MTVLYPDVAFVLNALLDGLVRRCTMGLMGHPYRWLRIAAAAVLGGLYGALAILPPLQFLEAAPWKLLVACGMVGLVYGKGPLYLRCCLLFLLASGTLSGIVTAMTYLFRTANHPMVIFLASGLFCAFSLTVVFRSSARAAMEGKVVKAALTQGGRTIHIRLLRDTGNTLADPETGQVICVVEEKALEPLLQGQEILYRKIPFQSLGQSRGELLCFTCENLTIEGAVLGPYPVGVASHPLTDGGGYVGLWGGEKGGANLEVAAKST